jgi:hypothetical protein
METIQIPSGPSKFVVGEAVPTGRELADWLLVWAKPLGKPRWVFEDTALGLVSPLFGARDQYNVGVPTHEYLKANGGYYFIANGEQVRRVSPENVETLMGDQKQGFGDAPYRSLDRARAWDKGRIIDWPPKDFDARLKGEVDFKNP